MDGNACLRIAAFFEVLPEVQGAFLNQFGAQTLTGQNGKQTAQLLSRDFEPSDFHTHLSEVGDREIESDRIVGRIVGLLQLRLGSEKSTINQILLQPCPTSCGSGPGRTFVLPSIPVSAESLRSPDSAPREPPEIGSRAAIPAGLQMSCRSLCRRKSAWCVPSPAPDRSPSRA